MPIVLVSVDSKNDKLQEFKSLNRHLDLVLESEDPRCRVLSDSVGDFTQRLVIDKLNDGSGSFQAVLNMVRSLSIQTAMIISHHSVINGWKAETISDEWEILEM
jgi:hypothetical protein